MTRRIIVTAVGLWIVFAAIGAVDLLATSLESASEAAPAISSADVRGNIASTGVFTEPLTPARLMIPRLGIDTTVEAVGKNARGNMTVPSTYQTVSWYRPGSRPGESGNAVVAGHLDNSLGLPGVFEQLHTLSLGDTVAVQGSDGKKLLYEVTSMTVYATEGAPAEDIFRTEGPSQLVLITCNGAWDHEKKSYDKRLVVVARPAS